MFFFQIDYLLGLLDMGRVVAALILWMCLVGGASGDTTGCPLWYRQSLKPIIRFRT